MESHLLSLKQKKIELISNCEEQTVQFGERLGRLLKKGDVVALSGELGSGKTYFTKGIASALGIPADVVTSPSFTLVNEYEGKYRLFHIDAYRLEKEDFLSAGLDEYFYEDGITVMEWADRWPEILPENTIWVKIEILDENKRKITIRGISDDNHRETL
ncbi:MAG: tRNA (adenosine(37)-N6)-threonylcarbamoyltransferase complex ATPase subunit type 1 TsaE [Deltaproteobacteria bacterium]|nr:MAG: tRNA (adenosine(37)-N6)-threonylcarbamoyltransferase complex ATPase subunit type 1 TsaE [Deltaproteobacteria bacterium]